MIIEHADVRRMLLMQKAYVEGSLSLILYAAMLVDRQKRGTDEEDRRKAGLLLDILTPMVKAWPSQNCFEASSQAVQVLGGYGYTKDYPVEQYFRENRLNMIHEGTNAIQGIDLLGRKVTIANGEAFRLLIEEITKTVSETNDIVSLSVWSAELAKSLRLVQETTTFLLKKKEEVGVDLFLANASLYLEMMGHVVMAWMWLRQAQAASRQNEIASEANQDFYSGKLQACAYFFNRELPKVYWQAEILVSLESTCYEMKDSWF